MPNYKSSLFTSDFWGIKKNYVADSLFFFGFAIWSLQEFIGYSEIHNIVSDLYQTSFRLIGLSIILISLFLRKILQMSASRFLLLTVILFFLAVNNGFLAGDTFWFDTVIIIFCSVNLNFNVFFYRTAVYRLLINFLLILMALMNFIPNLQANNSMTRIRFNLGYNWASYAAHTLLFIVLLFMWYYREKVKFWFIAVLFFLNFWIYLKTDTKAPFLLVMVILIFWLVASNCKITYTRSKLLYFLTLCILPLLTILIIVLSIHSNNFDRLNNLLSNRLQLGNFYIREYGFSWFGHSIFEFTDNDSFIFNYQTIDSGILRYLIKYGLLSSTIFMFLWTFSCKRIADLKNFYLDLVVIFLAIEAFSDPWFLIPSYNIFLVLIGSLFSSDSSKKMLDYNNFE